MVISNINGDSVSYPNKDIQTISFHEAIKVFSPEDCAGNGIAPDATVMTIALKDGNIATFEALNWCITSVE